MSGALAGLRVLECGTGVSAPFCARLLADLGADVVKAEPPGGDPVRGHGPFAGGRPHPERSGLFAWLNGGKRSILLSGDARADGALLGRLARRCDVLVTNLAAAERGRWGLDLAAAAESPALVTVVLGELGEFGPWSGRAAEEITVCALAGASAILGERERAPLHFPFALPALQAGLHGAAAALAALVARDRGAGGQRVEVAEADVLAFYCGGMSLFVLGGGGKWRRRGLDRHGAIYPSGFYPCQDGFVFIATQSRAQWTGFLRLMGDPAWAAEDPALLDGVAIGWRRADEVDLHFIPWLAQHTRRELTRMAREQNLVLGPVHTVDELLAEPHLAARGFWTEVELDGTRLRLPGVGYRLSATPPRIGRPPRLGEHAEEVRTEAAPTAPAPPAGLRPRRPLEGYRLLEFGWNWAGPLAGQMLADLGMETIKIETRERLDMMRHWQHAHPFFHNANRGKLSVTINVKQPAGVDLVRRLVARSDVVLDNFAAGVMTRNGLGWEALRRARPDVIVVSMAMAGQTGPLSHLRGFATTATGFAGLELLVGYPDTGPTGFQLLGLGDANAAVQAVVATLAALRHRERTGEGQFVDLSQIEAAAALVGEPLAEVQLAGRVPGPQANTHPRMAPHGIYPAAGREQWVAIAVRSDAEWRALAGAVGESAWAGDEALRTAGGRRARRDEIDARLAAWTATMGREALVELLLGVGVAAAPVLSVEELAGHPHLAARGLCREAPSFAGGSAVVYNTPWHLEATPPGVEGGSPTLGEHTREVLDRLLGMSAAEVAALEAERVIW